MATKLRKLRRWGVPSRRQVGAFAFLAFLGLVALSIFIVPPAFQSRTVFAAPAQANNEPWLKIKCLETEVAEGDDFRLRVDKKFDSISPHPTIRVFWYTDPITADETDYERLDAEGQASNGYQSRIGKMGRDFHTVDDNYPEIDETFKVRFNNSEDHGHDGECIITIHDDDGVGIYDLEITSVPGALPSEAKGVDASHGYIAGDWIEITAKFTGPVAAINPDTAQTAKYAGLYFHIGENRRIARLYQGSGTDTLVFSYQIKEDDLDANGISVEDGGSGTGLYYNQDTRDSGLWPVNPNTGRVEGRINRLFHGLDDDPEQIVAQVELGEPTITPPTETDVDVDPTPQPEPPEWVERSVVVENGDFHIEHGELTEEDGSRDWFSFTATGGHNYIIEVESRMQILLDGGTLYVDNHLGDPSILEILNEQGEQVLGEQDWGGFISNWARGYFTPQTDGAYYIAVGSGRQDRGGFGHYTISIWQDDHADDWRTQPDLVLLPGQSVTARIDSDVAPSDADPHAWAWGETGDDGAVPRWGIESADDKDVIRLEIAEAGSYRLSVVDGPAEVGLWAIFTEGGNGDQLSREAPVRSHTVTFQPGTYYIGVGTSYQSAGNTGNYTLAVAHLPD